MDVTVAKKDLLRLVARMQGVAERKGTMPILSTVLITATTPAGLRLAATDLYLAIAGSAHADVKKGGSVAVPAKDLFERVKMMPDGPVHLSVGENFALSLKAVGVKRRYTLRGVNGEDFPPLPSAAEGAPRLTLDVEVLGELIGRTSFSISTDETRAHLNSALFEWEGAVVRMVSTDGHRLSKLELHLETKRRGEAKMLLPLKAIRELQRVCEEVGAEGAKGSERPQLEIAQSGSSVFFDGGGLSFSAKLVDATFPPYEQVIPKSTTHEVTVPRALFADALRAVSIAASERTGGVKVTLSKGLMRITSESPESGEGFDEIPVEYTGPEQAYGFNAKYFLDILGALEEEEIILGLSHELDPCVVRPAGARKFVGVVMPMRI